MDRAKVGLGPHKFGLGEGKTLYAQECALGGFAIGDWRLAIGDWLLVVGCWLVEKREERRENRDGGASRHTGGS